MAHLRSGSIRTGGDQLKPDGGATVRTLGTDRLFIDDFVMVLFEPHQLKTLWTASYLRSHGLPLTLRLTD